MRVPRQLATLAVAAAEIWCGLATAYLLALLAASLRPAQAVAPAAAEPLRMVVLVPAHDEAPGITATVAARLGQDSPPSAREVIVVADNCTDATATRARAAGATVWERDAPAARGKGQALAWAIERLQRERPSADAVAIVDADCLASDNLLAGFAAALRGGAQAVQAAYDVANPDESVSAALRWAGFALMHRIRPRGRQALGLSADLFGTGMAFCAALLREHPWRSFSVTEDAEYHLELVEAGVAVAYLGAARVSSPMPRTPAAARAQQLRWESGNAALARRTAGRLSLAGLRRRDARLLHAGVEQLVPPQSLLALLNAGALTGAALLRRRRLAAAGAATALGQAAYVLGGLRAAGAPPAVHRALAAAPRLALAKAGVFSRIGAGRGASAWVRTVREPAGEA